MRYFYSLATLVAFTIVFSWSLNAQTTIYSNNFESCENSYSEFGAFSDGGSDYFMRTSGSADDTNCVSVATGTSGDVTYSNVSGLYYTAEDVDRAAENPNTTGEFGSTALTSGVHFNDINVSGFTNVQIVCSFASSVNMSYENGDYIRIYVDKTNNGTYELLGAFESTNGGGNTTLSQDTDLNGNGDGTVLSAAFQSFTFDLTGATSMDVRIEVLSSGSSEEMAFDTFVVQGTAASTMTASINSSTNESCSGSSDGSLTVTASDGTANYNYAWSNGATTSNTSSTTNTLSNLAAGTYTVTVTDNNGTTATASSTVSTETDNTAPTITVCASTPSNISASGSCTGTAPNLTGSVTATDNCTASPTITQSPASGATLGLGTTTITLTATDGSGNTATCTVNQTVIDATAPTITVCASTPSNISASGSCTGTAPNLTGSVTATDNCTASPTITQSPASGATLGLGTTTITLTATDGSGNTATCTVNQTVIDATAPTITVCASTPSNISASGSCTGTAPNLTGSVTATDNCTASPTVTQSPASGATLGLGTTTITLTATDGSGNTATCTVNQTVIDATAPTITVCASTPSNISASGSCTGTAPNLTGSVTATDNCTASPTITQSPASGATLGLGTTTITLTATDGSGNTATCTVNQTVIDATAPTITVCASTPADLPANASNQGTAPDLTGSVTATDNCTASPTITQSPASGATLGLGTTTITLTATDGSGNTATCTVNQTVAAGFSASVSSSTDESCSGSGDGSLTVTTSNGTANYNYVWSNGATTSNTSSTTNTLSNLAAGTYTVTVTDNNGTTATASSTVSTETDNTAPTITVCASTPSNISANGSCTGTAPNLTGSVTATDNCTASPTITQSPASGATLGLGTTTITLTATDGSGNTATCTVNQTVIDNTAPTITVCASTPSNISANGSCTGTAPNLTGSVTATDNCTASPTITQSPASGATLGLGTTTITLTATDGSGNTATCTVNQTVIDATAPTITVCASTPSNISASGSCTGTAPNLTGSVTATDNCTASPTITQSPASGATLGLGTTTITLTATDGSGNTATCTVNQTVIDATAPTITVCASTPSNISASGSCTGATPDLTGSVTATDNCTASPTITQSPASGATLGLGTTTITLTATDGSGNTATCTVNQTVIDATAPTITVCASTPSNISASGSCTGTAPNLTGSVTATDNCTASPTITQSPASGATLGLGTTTITLTATDGSGNTATCTVNQTVIDATAPTITVCASTPSNISASGSCTGTAPDLTGSVTATDNCTASPTITQSPASGATLGLGTTTITLTATDGSGNTATCTVNQTVIDATAPTITVCASTPSDLTANASNQASTPNLTGSLTATDNCTASPTITQSPASGATLGLGTTTITLTATDGSGNTATCTVNQTVVSPFSASITAQSNISCNGETDGSLTVTSTAGVANYSYQWSNGANTSNSSSSSNSITGLASGTYTVTVTDGNALTATASATVTEPVVLIAASIVDSNVSCNSFTDGGATASATGGTMPYNYVWSNSATTSSITGVAAGTYSVTITDANGCTSTSSATVTEPAVLIAASIIDSNVSCNSFTDGGATASATGGTMPYNYVWSNSATTSSITGVAAGTYSVTITDAKGCTSTSSATVTEPAVLIAASIIDSNVSCNSFTDGGATASATGGTMPYNYVWSNSATTSSITGVAAGTYSVTITDANGCTSTNSATVTEPVVLIAASIIDSNVSCNSFTDGGATASATGGTMPYNYVWSNSATNASITGVAAGTYSVTITDANGCTSTSSATVTEPVVLIAASIIDSNVSCNSFTDGGATASATGGTMPYNYVWSNSATNASITGVAAGTYSVTITDANGCTSTSSATVTEPVVLIAASIIDSNVSCNSFTDGGATASATGGTMPYNYVWSNSATTSSITGVAAGTYSVTITDANGCTSTSSATVTEPVVLIAASIVDSNVSCNSFTDGGATASATGGTMPYNYVWSNSATNASITGVAAGTYSVTITDANGCTSTSSATVTEPAVLIAASIIDSNVSCNSFTDGGATASATGGTMPYNYVWSNSAANASITGVAAGTYSVTITDANGCTSTSSATVTEPVVLIAASIIDSNVSCNSFTDGGATASATGGTMPYNYVWSNSATTSSITGVAAGTYSVTITDANGCTSTSSATVTEPVVLIAASIIDSNVSCNSFTDGGATASATGGTMPYNYVWSNSATTSSITGVAAGTYSVTITDANGCTSTSSATVTEPAVLSLSSVVDSNESCTGFNDGGISINVSGGTMPYNYAWSNSATTASITGIGVGTYTVTVTDNNGCVETMSTSVILLDTIDPTVITRSITAYLDATGNISIQASDVDSASFDACGIASMSVSPSSFNCTNVGSNTVSLTVTDINGNSSSASTIVIVVDTVKPAVITQNVTVYLDANGLASITTGDIDNGSSDACGISNMSLDTYSFDCNDLGSNTVSLTVTDVNNNSQTATAIVTVIDTIGPNAVAQNLTMYLDGNGQATITPQMADNGSSDNCALTYSLSQSVYGCGDEGLNLETLTVTDGQGNSSTATFLIDVQDTISPTLITQAVTIQLGATGQGSIAPSQLDNGSFDNCTNQLFYSAGKTSFDCNDLGVNVVTITITDTEGNSTTGTDTVIVEDNINPVVISSNITVQLDAAGQASITPSMINNGSNDNCTIDSIWVDKDSFSCSDIGQNSVLLSVMDESQNVSSTNAIVTVEDNINPMAIAQNVTVYLDANGQASTTASAVDNGSSDNCNLSNLSLDISSFDCSDLGSNTVSLTVTDSSGNFSSASTTVMVMDTVKPIVTTQNITVQLDASGMATITASMIDAGSTDNCSVQSLSLDQTSFSCSDIGSPVTINFTVTDGSSNSQSATAIVTVEDQMNPVAQAQNLTIYLAANGDASITPSDIDNGSFDNCGIDSLNLDISVFDCADLGQNLVTLTAVDSSSNSNSASAFVTVLDTISPSIDNLPTTITAYAGSNQCATTVQWPTITASDNCNSTFVNTSQINGGLFSIGTTTVSVNAFDGSGNSIIQTFDVTVLDTVSPIITGLPFMFNTTPNTNTCDAQVSWVAPTAFDNCGSVTLTSTHSPGTTFPVGNTTVIYTATDADGNASTASFVITVADVISPIINNTPADIAQTADAGSCSAVVNFTLPTVTDNCSGATLASSHTSGSIFSVGTTTVSFTATDAAGNISNSSFDITVTDDEDPIALSVPANDTVGPCNAAYVYALPTGSDNCGAVTVTQISGLPSGNIFPVGITQNVFRISDASGNDTVVDFTIVIVPQGQPQLPSLIEVCVNAPDVDITLGQNIVWTGNGATNNGTVFSPAQAGVGRHLLSYSFTDDQGCVATGNISITVLPAPSEPVIVRVASTTLSTVASYATYQWYRDGILLSGANSQTYSYTVGGNYQVVVGNSSGCEVFGDGFAIGSGGSGIGIEEHWLSQLSLYPNPTEGAITIDLNHQIQEDLEIKLFSIDGKKLFERTVRSEYDGKLSLDFSHLPDATYFMHIQTDNNLVVRKILLY